MARYALSTKDNPFNPFDDYVKWLDCDNEFGYHSQDYLSRVYNNIVESEHIDENTLSNEEEDSIIEQAIDEIVKDDPIDVYIKVKENDK